MIGNSVAFIKLETEAYLIYNLRPAYISKKRLSIQFKKKR